jgi:hypothetical protein
MHALGRIASDSVQNNRTLSEFEAAVVVGPGGTPLAGHASD